MVDPNKDEELFTIETLRSYAKRAEALHHDILFDTDNAGADPFAEQEYLLALAHLEQAQRHFALAALHQARGLAGR